MAANRPSYLYHWAASSPSRRAWLIRQCGRNIRPSCRAFHDYFVTLLPSSSLHPDSGPISGPSHKLPRSASTPHKTSSHGPSPASFHHPNRSSHDRELTTVRIPLKSAKHHFGASCSRGTRPYNEDTYQAGTILLPAFAKKGPPSVTTGRKPADAQGATTATGDPQVFYFGIFDGHGGDNCSIWLREKLHGYLETAVKDFGLQSSLSPDRAIPSDSTNVEAGTTSEVSPSTTQNDASSHEDDAGALARKLVEEWRDTVGGYFRRFKPEYFPEASGGKGHKLASYAVTNSGRLEPSTSLSDATGTAPQPSTPTIEGAVTYAFLRGDLDFTVRQAQEAGQAEEEDDYEDSSFGRHSHHSQPPFLGGSTCSIALISTPTPTPFWNPNTPLSVLSAHVGDTRILLCSVQTGQAISITQDHHPSAPVEADRLRRFSGMVTTDSFGEERISGLANTRSFGDARSKRIGVSAEPEMRLINIAMSSQYSFLALVSDGVTAHLSDQDIVDTVKEAKTPEQGAREVVSLATDLGSGEKGNADNATALVVRLGGWERRAENGGGGMHTKEERDWRRAAANDPRRGRT